MSFRTAALIALLIGTLAASAFSFAVIAYVKAQETEEARRVDRFRTDAEIKRLAEAVFRENETAPQRSRRIREDVKVRIKECGRDAQCVAAGRRVFGLSTRMLRLIAREEVRLYCAARDECRGRMSPAGKDGRNGRNGTNGKPGASTGPDPRVAELVRDVETLRRAVTDLQSRKQDSAVLNGLDNRVADLERGVQGLQQLVDALCHILTPNRC